MSTSRDSYLEFALDYVKENKYAYGPVFSSVDLIWEVEKVEENNSGVIRIFINYKTSKDSKNFGSEYIDIDSGLNVLSRRQIKILKEPKPFVLMIATFFSVIIAVISIYIMIFEPFSGDNLYVSGRTLWMRVEKPLSIDSILYESPDTTGQLYYWDIMPTDIDSNQLALVEITLTNQKSNSIKFNVDNEAAELQTADNLRYNPIEILERATVNPNGSSHKGNVVEGFIPIWGSIELNRGEQIRGYIIFEVPKNSDYVQFRWKAADTILVNY